MTPSHRYRYAYLISLLGLLGIAVAVLLPSHSSTEVSTVDEPTTTATVPPTTATTSVPETTTVPVPETTTVVEPTTEAPAPPEPTAGAEIPAAPALAAAAIPADPTPTPAVRVETGCTNDPACTAPPEPDYRQPPDWAACPQWWETAQAAGWPASAMDKLDYVMKRESGCNQYAHNPSGASGLVQLLPMHWRGKFDPYNPFDNLHKGYELWLGSGWSPWEVCGFRRGC